MEPDTIRDFFYLKADSRLYISLWGIFVILLRKPVKNAVILQKRNIFMMFLFLGKCIQEEVETTSIWKRNHDILIVILEFSIGLKC